MKRHEAPEEPPEPWALGRSWPPGTLLFEVLGAVLPMHLAAPGNAGVTPLEVGGVWEAWGVAYASRLRFAAQADDPARWLNPREDRLPAAPLVTKLMGKQSILQALALELTQRNEEARSHAEASSRRRQKDSHGGKWMKKEEGFLWQAPAAPGASRLGNIWPPLV